MDLSEIMELAIVIVCTLIVVALFIAVVVKAVSLAKQSRRYRKERKQIADSEKYLLDIVQNGKTVHIECKDVTNSNVEFIADGKGGES